MYLRNKKETYRSWLRLSREEEELDILAKGWCGTWCGLERDWLLLLVVSENRPIEAANFIFAISRFERVLESLL
jgi:hypothetical protein